MLFRSGIIQGAIELHPSDWLKSRLTTPHTGSDGSQCNSQTLLMRLSNGTTNLKSYLAVSLRLNIHLPCDSAIPFLGIYPREMKTYVLQKTCIRMFRAALFIIAPNWKQPKCPSTGGWRDITLPTKVRLVKVWFFQWSCMDVRVGLRRMLSAEELMLLNCGVGEDS